MKNNVKTSTMVADGKSISYKWMFWFVGILSILLYVNTLGHGFVLDDIAVVQENKFVKNGISGIPDILRTFYWQGYWNSNSGLYRPMSLITFAIEWELMPNSPFIHHFMNVMFYVLTNLLLFTLLRYFFRNYSVWIPFLIVLLFASHPIHTEVVANIKSRDEILCLLFFLVTLYFLICKEGKFAKIASFLFFLFALLSKEAGILFLPVIVFLLWMQSNKDSKKTIIEGTPFVAITLVWLMVHQYVISSSPFPKITYAYTDNSMVNCPDKATQIATGFSILGRYIQNAVYPVTMSYDYSFNQIPCVGFATFSFWSSLLLVLLLLGTAIYGIKKWVGVSIGIFFFFITIAFATNILFLIGTTMGDRLLYTPVLGLIIAAVFGVHYFLQSIKIQPNHKVLMVVFGLISISYSYQTITRNKVWQSNFTLFTSDINHAPNSARVAFNYATAFFNQLPGDVAEQQSLLPNIIQWYERALAIDPKDKGSLVNVGVCYYRIKDYTKALHCTTKAMQMDPNDKSLYGNLADIYFMLGNNDKAISYYQKCIALDATHYNTYNFYGVALFNMKKYADAISIFEKGIAKEPNHAQMWLNYGNALAISNHMQEAIKAFEKAYALNPNQRQALNCLFMAYRALGDFNKANYYYQLYVKK